MATIRESMQRVLQTAIARTHGAGAGMMSMRTQGSGNSGTPQVILGDNSGALTRSDGKHFFVAGVDTLDDENVIF